MLDPRRRGGDTQSPRPMKIIRTRPGSVDLGNMGTTTALRSCGLVSLAHKGVGKTPGGARPAERAAMPSHLAENEKSSARFG